MEHHWNIVIWAALALCSCLTFAIPSSLVDQIKQSELRTNKVKRVPLDLPNGEGGHFFNNPSAIKRGTNLKNIAPEQQSESDWDADQSFYQNTADVLPNVQSALYNNGENPFDDKTIAEYEKGFQYGTNKEKLDESLENAVLKSELYGDPSAINEYRYYGGTDKKRRRKRRNVQRMRFGKGYNGKQELSPEEILAMLTLYENEQQLDQNNNYRWQPAEQTYSFNPLKDDLQQEDDENWSNTPVYPHVSGRIGNTNLDSRYGYEDASTPNSYDKRDRWGSFSDYRSKRFMVAKKRNDPTREIRYLNGPNKNDFYTLSQLLNNQREPNVPLYHRFIL